MLDNFVKQLGEDLKMSQHISSLETGQYKVTFDEDLEVILSRTPTNAYLFKGKIGPFPKIKEEEFLQRVLEANLFGKGTYGGVIGLTEDEKVLTLSQELDYNSNYKEWKEKLEDFLNVIDYWKKETINYT